MFRRYVGVAAAVVVMISVLTMTSRAGSRQDTGAGAAPIVGSWIVTFPDLPSAPPSLYTFTSDNTVVGNSISGARHGAWAVSDSEAPDYSIDVVGVIPEAEGPASLLQLWGSLIVSDDQNSFSLLYYAQAVSVDGTVTAVEGPFQALGFRIEAQPVEGRGTPQAGGAPQIIPIGSPDASPAAA